MPEEPLEEQIKSQRAFSEDLQRQIEELKEQNGGERIEEIKKFEDLFYKDIIKCKELWLGNITGITKCIYYLGTNQSIPDNTEIVVAYDTKEKDSLEEFDTANNRWVATQQGDYSIKAGARLALPKDGCRFYLKIRKNGSNIAAAELHSGLADGYLEANVTTDVEMDEGDYIDAVVLHTHGDARNIQGSRDQTNISIYKIG